MSLRALLEAAGTVFLVVSVVSWLNARGDRNEAVDALKIEESERLAADLRAEGLLVEWGQVNTDLLDSLAIRDERIAELIEEHNAQPIALADVVTEAADTVLVPVEVYRDSLAAEFAGPPLWGRIAYFPERYEFSLRWQWFDELRLIATRTSDGRYLLAAESASGDRRIRYATNGFYIEPPKYEPPKQSIDWLCIGSGVLAGFSASKEAWVPAGVFSLGALWRCR